jgi:flagellar biosynthetic protein FliR
MYPIEHGWMAAAPWLLLAAARWFGLLLMMPGLTKGIVPLRIRGAMAVLLAMVMLPALADPSWTELAGLTLPKWLLLGVAELATGAALGTGMRIVFAGLRVAGELIDHQAGLALSQSFDPAGDEPVTPAGQVLAWGVIAAFLLLSPLGGDVQVVAAMLDLFAALPPGSGITAPPGDLLIVLVHRSLDLSVRAAAPVLALMSLVTVAFAFLNRSLDGRGPAPLESPLRVVICLVVLAASLSPVSEMAADGLRSLLESAPTQLVGAGSLSAATVD